MGRPSLYTEELADKICERIATSELGLEQVLAEIKKADGEAPHFATVYRWLDENEEFREKSARARRLQGDTLVDLAVRESFNARIGRIEKQTPKGDEVTIADNVARSQLIVQTLLKRAGQLNPKKYGEKLDMNLGGEVAVKRVVSDL